MFERTMEALGVDRRQWSYRLAPHLTGKAQQAFACMSREDCGSYDAVRVAILQRYNITTETYYQRFVEKRKMLDESFVECTVRMRDVTQKWTKACQTKDNVLEMVMIEQFQKILSPELQIQIRQRRPTTLDEAASVADNVLEARKITKKMDTVQSLPKVKSLMTFFISTSSPLELIFYMWLGNALKFYLSLSEFYYFVSNTRKRREKNHVESDRPK